MANHSSAECKETNEETVHHFHTTKYKAISHTQTASSISIKIHICNFIKQKQTRLISQRFYNRYFTRTQHMKHKRVPQYASKTICPDPTTRLVYKKMCSLPSLDTPFLKYVAMSCSMAFTKLELPIWTIIPSHTRNQSWLLHRLPSQMRRGSGFPFTALTPTSSLVVVGSWKHMYSYTSGHMFIRQGKMAYLLYLKEPLTILNLKL